MQGDPDDPNLVLLVAPEGDGEPKVSTLPRSWPGQRAKARVIEAKPLGQKAPNGVDEFHLIALDITSDAGARSLEGCGRPAGPEGRRGADRRRRTLEVAYMEVDEGDSVAIDWPVTPLVGSSPALSARGGARGAPRRRTRAERRSSASEDPPSTGPVVQRRRGHRLVEVDHAAGCAALGVARRRRQGAGPAPARSRPRTSRTARASRRSSCPGSRQPPSASAASRSASTSAWAVGSAPKLALVPGRAQHLPAAGDHGADRDVAVLRRRPRRSPGRAASCARQRAIRHGGQSRAPRTQ